MHAPNALIACIGDVKVTPLIKANPGGTVKLGAFRRATIAFKTSHTRPCNYMNSVAIQI
jgi:hypothetical protein